MSLMGWLSGWLERDRKHRQAIADGARLRTRHARAQVEAQRRTGNSR